MTNSKFCFQCEQTADCKGCNGIAEGCSKSANMSPLQQKLIGALIGLARIVDGNEGFITEDMNKLVIESLFSTETNINFDDGNIQKLIDRVHNEKNRLSPNCALCASPCDRTADYDMKNLWNANKDICRLKIRILFNIRSMAVYAYRADMFDCVDKDATLFFYKALAVIGTNLSADELLPVLIEAEEIKLKYKELHDNVNINSLENAEFAETNLKK